MCGGWPANDDLYLERLSRQRHLATRTRADVDAACAAEGAVRDVNVTLSNYSPGSGPASASVDITATWLDDGGIQRSGTRTGVTLSQLWSRPAISAAIKQEAIQDLLWKLVRLDLGIDG